MPGPASQPASQPRRPRAARRFVLLGLAVAAVAAAAYFLYPHIDADHQWHQARRAFDRNDFPAAQAHLRRCLEVWPDSAETQFFTARTCRRAGDLDEAARHLRKARLLGWDRKLVRLESLLLQAQTGAVQPVEAELKDFLSSHPEESKMILEALTIGCLRSNILDDAHVWCSYWIEYFPDDWLAHYWRGLILERTLHYETAAEEYRRVLDQNPDHAPSHRRRAEVLIGRGRFKDALPHLRTYLRTDPDNPDALFALARCQRSLGSPKEAWDAVQRGLARSPDSAAGLLVRGQLELDRDQPARALPFLRRARAGDPNGLESNLALATALHRLKRDDEARVYDEKKKQVEKDMRRMDELVKQIPKRPKDLTLRCEAASILLRLGQEQDALRWLVGALLIDPNHREARNLLADYLRQQNDPKLREAYRPFLEGRRGASPPAPAGRAAGRPSAFPSAEKGPP